MRALALLLSALVAVHASFPPEGMRLTPYGLRPASCVLEVPSGSTVKEVAEGLKVTSELDGVIIEKLIAVPEECHQDNILQRYNQMRQAHLSRKSSQVNAFPINGWLDNAGWYPPSTENDLDSFVSTYTIPGNPASNSGQVLFYFIGFQDNAYSAVNIVQPVLTWGNGSPGWNAASWCCCPKNITVESKTIAGLSAGQHIQGTVKRQSADTWMIDTKVVETGANSTLYAQVGDYNYDWADVTQEVYNVYNCQQFATGAMTFASLTMKDSAQAVLTPKWTITGITDCNGHETQVDGTTITIAHN